jgi:hypothetical protein
VSDAEVGQAVGDPPDDRGQSGVAFLELPSGFVEALAQRFVLIRFLLGFGHHAADVVQYVCEAIPCSRIGGLDLLEFVEEFLDTVAELFSRHGTSLVVWDRCESSRTRIR